MKCAGVCIIKSNIPSCIPKLTVCICIWYLATTWPRALRSTHLLKLHPTTVERQLNYLPLWQSNNLSIILTNWYCVTIDIMCHQLSLHCIVFPISLTCWKLFPFKEGISFFFYDFQTIQYLSTFINSNATSREGLEAS